MLENESKFIRLTGFLFAPVLVLLMICSLSILDRDARIGVCIIPSMLLGTCLLFTSVYTHKWVGPFFSLALVISLCMQAYFARHLNFHYFVGGFVSQVNDIYLVGTYLCILASLIFLLPHTVGRQEKKES